MLRDWGEAHRADAFLRRSVLPPFSDPAFLSARPPVPPALLSYPAAPDPATASASMSVHSSFQNCYASSRSISLTVLIAPSSALINGSLTPSVIGDRPSHPIYRLTVTQAERFGRVNFHSNVGDGLNLASEGGQCGSGAVSCKMTRWGEWRDYQFGISAIDCATV